MSDGLNGCSLVFHREFTAFFNVTAQSTDNLGLSPHMDAGSYERWVDPAFQRIYASIFNGQFDPWQAAFRTKTREYASPAVSSMFRTFQGWTSLTEQGPDDGTLQLLPIANAIGYVLLRALQDDVPDDELCLAKPGRALGVDQQWHPDLMPAIEPSFSPSDTDRTTARVFFLAESNSQDAIFIYS